MRRTVVALCCLLGAVAVRADEATAPSTATTAPVTAAADPSTAAVAACPAHDVAHLGRTRAQLLQIVLSATQSADPQCAALGRAVADWLDRDGATACAAAAALIAADAQDADTLALRAALAWRCGHPREAFDSARSALARDARATLAWTTLGRVLEARFRPVAARAAYERASAIDPRDPDALLGLARVLDTRAGREAALRGYLDVALASGEPAGRVRGARENLELIGVLGDRPVWIVERADLPGTLRIDALSGDPGRITGWVLSADIGEALRVPTLIDSGASGLHLADNVGARSGLVPLADALLLGGGGSGQHHVGRGTVDTLAFGPLTFRQALGAVAERSLHPRGLFRAILGLDVLGGTRVTLDPKRRELTIDNADSPEDGDDPLAVDPWPRDPRTWPLLRVEGQLLAPVTLIAPGDDVPLEVLMLIDTGAGRTLLDRSVAERMTGFRRSDAASVAAYGGDMALAGRVPRLRVQLEDDRPLLYDVGVFDLTERARLVGITVSGFLGNDLIAQRRVVFDLAAGTVRLAPLKGETEP